MGTLSRIAASLPIPERARLFFAQTPVRGTLKDIDVHAAGEPDIPENWFGSLSLKRLSLKPGLDGTPGFSGLSADIRGAADSKDFEITLNSPDSTLTLPGLFRHPTMRFDVLRGKATLTLGPRPRITIAELAAQNADAAVTAKGTFEFADLKADLSGKITRARAQNIVRYLPNVIGDETLNWLEAGILQGRGTGGDWTLKGDLHHFPWHGNRDGLFRVRAHVEDGVLDVLPSHVKLANGRWQTGAHYPLLSHIQADLLFEGDRMLIKAKSASTAGLKLKNALVEIPDFTAPSVTLKAKGEAEGDLSDALTYLNTAPDLVEHLGRPFKTSNGQGPIALDLSLTLPLNAPQNFGLLVNGNLKGVSMLYDEHYPLAEDLKGAFRVTREGVQTGAPITGRTNAGPLSLAVRSDKRHVELKLEASARAQDLDAFLPQEALPFTSRLSGVTPITLDVDIPLTQGPMTIRGASTLAGLSSTLPVPFDKPGPEPWPLRFTWTTETNERSLELSCPGHADIRVRFKADAPVDTLAGTLSLGNAAAPSPPNSQGLAVAVNAPSVDIDEWRTLFPSSADTTFEPQAFSQSPLTQLSARIGRLHVADETFTDLDATLRRFGGTNWHLRIASDAARGQIEWLHPTGQPPTLSVKMNRLYWPSSGHAAAGPAGKRGPDIRPFDLPNLNVVVDDLRYGSRQFGKVELTGRNALTHAGTGHYDIRRIVLTSPSGSLTGHGLWQPDGAGDATGRTNLQLDADFSDSGRLLDALDVKNVLRNAPAKLSAQLTWRGLPYRPDIETLTGRLAGNLSSGQILQVEPGAGRLLSLFSMQHLLKRLRLDFSDVVSKGFGFDSVTANISINNGVAGTDHFAVVGSSATIVITGTTDFVREKLDLDALVLPKISAEGPALALTLANPAVGLGTLVAQWLLKDEISKWLKTRYHITGNFDEPIVEKYKESAKPTSRDVAAPPR